jgi:hypothetical protein
METTEKTGADLAADTLTEKLEAAGWKVRSTRGPAPEPARFSDGRLMIPRCYSVFLHADGPRSAGRPYLGLYWRTITEAAGPEHGNVGDTEFLYPEIRIGDMERKLSGEAEMHTWLDALNAVAAAVDGP